MNYKKTNNKKKDINLNKTSSQVDAREYSNEILRDILELPGKAEVKQEKFISKENYQNFIDDVSKEYDTSRAIAAAGIYATLQAGGTSKNKRSNVKVNIENVSFESKCINTILQRNCKGITPRQFAKIFAKDIFQCSLKYQIIGNAYVYIKRFYGDKLREVHDINERFWCSDFQIDNAECPEYIRELLRQRYADKFRRNLV